MHPARECAQLLAKDAVAVCRMLLPLGKRKGEEWVCGNIQGDPGDSLHIALDGPNAGMWLDHADPECKGDLVTLWAMTQQQSVASVLPAIRDYLGLPPAVEGIKKRYSKPEKPRDAAPLTEGFISWFEERGISREVVKKNRVGSSGSAICYPQVDVNGKPVAYRYRLDTNGEKRFWSSKDTPPCVFGRLGVNQYAREIIITEGFEDALLLQTWGFDAVSVPFGGGDGRKQQWIEYEFDWLSQFDVIYWCQDSDAAGRSATKELVDRLGYDRVKVVRLGHKDPTDWYRAGGDREAFSRILLNSTHIDVDHVVNAGEFWDGVDAYYESLNDPNKPSDLAITFDEHNEWKFPVHSFIIHTGFSGVGKSLWLGQMALLAGQQGFRTQLASMEMTAIQTLVRMEPQVLSMRDATPEYRRKGREFINQHIWIYDLVGTVKPEDILRAIEYGYMRYGIQLVVIDSLLKCGISEGDVDAQKEFCNALCALRNKYPLWIILVAHQVKPSEKHDKSEPRPTKYGIRGYGSITDLADYVIGQHRWKDKPDEDAPDGFLIPLKWREGIEPAQDLALWLDPSNNQLRRGSPLVFV